MTRQEFRELCENGPVILDGAMGSNLVKAGMTIGECPEQWILEHRDVALQLQKAFVEAGTKILYAPTFTGNRVKLAGYGLDKDLVRINRELVQLSKEAAQGKAFVAGDMTMTGEQLYPFGDMEFEELIDIYKEQAQALCEAGADLFIIETMMSLQETRAAVIAIRETCDLPVMASLTFEEGGRTIFGNTPEAAVVTLQSLGADAVGMNCSTGPEGMLENLKKMAQYAEVPLLAKPNAGLPVLVDGKATYPTEPEEFAEAGKKLAEAGACLIGGCCGTTPEHIARLAECVKTFIPPAGEKQRILASERGVAEIPVDAPLCGSGGSEIELLPESAQALSGEDPDDLLEDLSDLTQEEDSPLCIDPSSPEVVEALLRAYPGRALIDAVTWEKDSFDRLIPLAEKYGAMFIFRPVTDAGDPKTPEEIVRIIGEAAAALEKRGIARETMVADPRAAAAAREMLAHLE